MSKKMSVSVAAVLALSLAAAGAQAAGNHVSDFESGEDGWQGPQGPGGASFINPTGGVGGSAGYQTQFNNFGISFVNSTNASFLGDYTAHAEVTVSLDLKIDQIGTFLPVPRPFVLELRDFDTAQGGFPWTSVWYEFGWFGQDDWQGFQNFSVTIDDPNSTTLPAGWGGFGAEDPNTFEPILPAGVTFADVLSGVDEIAITTLEPGFFFAFDDYDVTLDNISIVVPTPGALSAFAACGLVGLRRRRR